MHCIGGSNPLIFLPPQERTTSTNNQPWTPNRLRRSHRCKRHTERYTQSFSCIRFISAMNISFGSRVSSACCLPGWKKGEEMMVLCGWGGGIVGNGVAPDSSIHLTGNMLSHILSLSETLVCFPVAGLFRSYLTLLTTQRLVVQPEQICSEFVFFPGCIDWT